MAPSCCSSTTAAATRPWNCWKNCTAAIRAASAFCIWPKTVAKPKPCAKASCWRCACGADYVGFWDADLATPLEDIDGFCKVLDAKPQIHVVLGARMRLLGHKVERPPARFWIGRICAAMASMALGSARCRHAMRRQAVSRDARAGRDFRATVHVALDLRRRDPRPHGARRGTARRFRR